MKDTIEIIKNQKIQITNTFSYLQIQRKYFSYLLQILSTKEPQSSLHITFFRERKKKKHFPILTTPFKKLPFGSLNYYYYFKNLNIRPLKFK